MTRKFFIPLTLGGLLLGSPLTAANTDAVPEGYQPFPLQWDDTLAGTATDVSFLNEKPAGKTGV